MNEDPKDEQATSSNFPAAISSITDENLRRRAERAWKAVEELLSAAYRWQIWTEVPEPQEEGAEISQRGRTAITILEGLGTTCKLFGEFDDVDNAMYSHNWWDDVASGRLGFITYQLPRGKFEQQEITTQVSLLMMIAVPTLKEYQKVLERDPEAAFTGKDCRAGPDFRCIRWYGEVYSFSPNQAKIIEVLWDAWEAGTPDVGGETLRLEVDPDAPPPRVDVIFRDSPAWGKIIGTPSGKGLYRLIAPSE